VFYRLAVCSVILLFVLHAPSGVQAQTVGNLTGKVTRVKDGDTFVLVHSQSVDTVRLHSADTPERGQPYGKEAALALERMVLNREVVADCYKKDRHERSVCRVTLGGRDVAASLVAAGAAWYASGFSKEFTAEEKETIPVLQQTAQSKRLGLWADAEPIAPWEWRKQKPKQ
jgi:micrococcal nuclease